MKKILFLVAFILSASLAQAQTTWYVVTTSPFIVTDTTGLTRTCDRANVQSALNSGSIADGDTLILGSGKCDYGSTVTFPAKAFTFTGPACTTATINGRSGVPDVRVNGVVSPIATPCPTNIRRTAIAAAFTWTCPADPANNGVVRFSNMEISAVGSLGIATLGAITGGSGYVDGVYLNVALTDSTVGSNGNDARATVTVAGGAVTSVVLQFEGNNYGVNDSISASNTSLGGAGSGFVTTVATLTASVSTNDSGTVQFTCSNLHNEQVRMDHIFFNMVRSFKPGNNFTMERYFQCESCVGVADHNYILYPAVKGTTDVQVLNANNWDDDPGNPVGTKEGDFSWCTVGAGCPATGNGGSLYPWDGPGTNDVRRKSTMFFEDNVFDAWKQNLCNEGEHGGRAIYRFSTYIHCNLQSHGTETGNYRGARQVEYYMNVFDWKVYKNTNSTFQYSDALKSFTANVRSAAGLSWGNVMQNGSKNGQLSLLTYDDYRMFLNQNATGEANGSNIFDVNDPGGPFDVDPVACPGSTCGVTTFIGGSTSSTVAVTVMGANFGNLVDYQITKQGCTAGSSGQCTSPITSNTATQINYAACTGVCAANMQFTPGVSTFKIYKVTHSVDQPGRGGGSLFAGAGPGGACVLTPPNNQRQCTGWVGGGANDQTAYPWYEWGNCGIINNDLNFPTDSTCQAFKRYPTTNSGQNSLPKNATMGPRSEGKPVIHANSEFYSWAGYPCGKVYALDLDNAHCFDGSSGTGVGLKADMNAIVTCTQGVAYWVTDEGSWNTTLPANTSGQLYRCGASNNWVLFYTPYTYPHPLVLPPDATFPTAGGGGTITPTHTSTTVTLTWTKGTDADDAQNTLNYSIYRSNSANIDTIQNIFSNGTNVITSLTDNTGSSTIQYTVTGLNSNQAYTFNIIIADPFGNQTAYTQVTDTTTGGPTVSITAPSNGATVSGPTVSYTANASSALGIAGVTFFDNAVQIGSEDTSSPYGITWDTTGLANGPHALTAVARDNNNGTTTSGTVNVTVSNGAAGQGSGPIRKR